MMFKESAVNFKNASDLSIEKTIGGYRLKIAFGRYYVVVVIDDKNTINELKQAGVGGRSRIALELLMWLSSGDGVVTKEDIYEKIHEIYSRIGDDKND